MIDDLRWRPVANGALLLVLGALMLSACIDESEAPPVEDDDDSALVPRKWKAIDTSAIAAGITADGEVVFWGSGQEGPLGKCTPPPFPTPPEGRFDAVRITGGSWCAIREDRVLRCGDDGWSMPREPTGDAPVLHVAQAGRFACAVLDDGSITCWTGGSQGPIEPPPSGNYWAQVEVSGGGHPGHPESPVGCALTRSGTLVCWGDGALAQQPSPSGRFVDVSIFYSWGCAIDEEAHLQCWGEEDSVQPPPDGEFVQVSVSEVGACALTVEGEVRCWGDNHHFLEDEQPDLPGPTEPPEGRFLQVAASVGYACGVREDQSLTCWGSIYSGAQNPPE